MASSQNPVLGIALYLDALAERRLAASRCGSCGQVFLPPRPICSTCRGRGMSAEELSGRGRVAAVTSIAIPPSAMAAKGYGRRRPYVTGVVTLEEGPSLTARIDLPEHLGGSLQDRVGMPVTAAFEDEEGSVTLIFRPA